MSYEIPPHPPAAVSYERQHFKTLLLQNPNYFGNLVESDFAAIKPIKSDTSFEQLVCVGLNPARDRLEGVIDIKREGGYGGPICEQGTREHVRFFVDLYDNGTWHDVGVTSVRVHDVAGDKPLSYGVHLDFSPYKKLCKSENIVRVRAIMQWNAPPPSDPDYAPVWGNRVDVEVQIKPATAVKVSDVFHDLALPGSVAPNPLGPILDVLDPSALVPAAAPKALSFRERRTLYERADVPLHRFAFPEVSKFLKLADPNALAAPGASAFATLGLSSAQIESLVSAVIKTDGNTSFEELRCIGFDPDARMLEGVFTVKAPTGYGGPLCSKGTTEYVAFYIDFGEGAGLEHVGTATVNVHDLATIPNGDVQYAVYLKRDFTKYRIPCEMGPRVVHLRAILSWEDPPPPSNPNHVPVWGNREDRLIQLAPTPIGGHGPKIQFVGGVEVDDIGFDGLTIGGESPFGGAITLRGHIGDPPDSFGGGAAELRYRIQITGPPPFDTPQYLMDPMVVQVDNYVNGFPVQCAPGEDVCSVTLTPTDATYVHGPGWYTYLNDTKGPEERHLLQDLLATWSTNVAMEGTWTIGISALDPATSVMFTGDTVTVRVDNTAPSGPAGPTATTAQNEAMPPLWIESATLDGLPIEAVGCGKFPVGSIITGGYEVHDPGMTAPEQHFGGMTLDVIPDDAANGAATVPSARSYPLTIPTTGAAGTWTLDTSAMDPCGYVIRMQAWDRTNVNSGAGTHWFTWDIGFCLEEPDA
jgi:hypothetical protein